MGATVFYGGHGKGRECGTIESRAQPADDGTPCWYVRWPDSQRIKAVKETNLQLALVAQPERTAPTANQQRVKVVGGSHTGKEGETVLKVSQANLQSTGGRGYGRHLGSSRLAGATGSTAQAAIVMPPGLHSHSQHGACPSPNLTAAVPPSCCAPPCLQDGDSWHCKLDSGGSESIHVKYLHATGPPPPETTLTPSQPVQLTAQPIPAAQVHTFVQGMELDEAAPVNLRMTLPKSKVYADVLTGDVAVADLDDSTLRRLQYTNTAGARRALTGARVKQG